MFLKHLFASCFLIGFSFCVATSAQSVGQEVVGQDVKTEDVEKVDEATKALHEKLAKYLSGTKWTGNFTVTGSDKGSTEHYEIISAEKGEIGDYWNLIARIKYGGKDKTLPLPPIEIKFAGKTPVITVDRVVFPGFGTFDARVLIRQGKYAGTWAHSGGIGGHLFGTIERMDEDVVKDKVKAVKETERETEKNDESPKKDK